MEAAGDSKLIVGDDIDQDSIEFERNLDAFKKTLETEENRLSTLEQQQIKLCADIQEMFREITEEKAKHRKALDRVIEEREMLSRKFIEGCKDVAESLSSMSLLDQCKESGELSKNLDFNVGLDIEKIRCDLMENYIATKEDYLSTMKDHIVQKKKQLEDDSK